MRRTRTRTGARTRVAQRRAANRIHLTPADEPAQHEARRAIAALVANTTLLTALLYYFGIVFTQVFFAYFRVHYTLLGQPPDEILGRGAYGLFIPLTTITAAVLVAALAIRLLRHHRWLVRLSRPAAAITGTVAITAPLYPNLYPGLPGLGLATGTLLLVFALRGTSRHVAESVATFILVAIGLFWAVGEYSAQVGLREGYEVAARIPAMASVVVYSTARLGLTHETRCVDEYRYHGLKLLLQSGGQYVFVPADWNQATGIAYVIPKTTTMRLEMRPPGSTPPAGC